jgi:uncharacterized protein (TIGR02246 family)
MSAASTCFTNFHHFFIGAVTFLSLSATTGFTNEAESIKKLTQRWIDASATGDVEAYFSFVTDDFSWIGNLNDGGYQGRDQVRAFVEPFFQTMKFSLENWTSDDVVVSGDGNQAVHIWTGTAISINKDGSDEVAQHRKYIDFWSKQPDETWLCTRHTFVVLGEP